jgi:hypothetical protein
MYCIRIFFIANVTNAIWQKAFRETETQDEFFFYHIVYIVYI